MSARRKYGGAGKTFRPRAWHLYPRYPVQGPATLWLASEIAPSVSANSYEDILVKISRGFSFRMYDRKLISFTDQCVCSRLNHVRVYGLHLWTALFVHNFCLLNPRSLRTVSFLASPAWKTHAKTCTFTETDQWFFWTMKILFGGEETLLVALIVLTTSFCVMIATYSQPVVMARSKINLKLGNSSTADIFFYKYKQSSSTADFVWYEYNWTAHVMPRNWKHFLRRKHKVTTESYVYQQQINISQFEIRSVTQLLAFQCTSVLKQQYSQVRGQQLSPPSFQNEVR